MVLLQYSLNLMNISDTTAKIQGKGMGLCGFATMLFSLLSLLCFLNAFPHRKKVNVPMLVLMVLMVLRVHKALMAQMVLMVGVLLFCDQYYLKAITNALTRAQNPIKIGKNTLYIAKANNMLNDHMVILIVGVVLTALLPLYAKLLRKINTSVSVEDNGKLDAIDISGED